MCFSARIANRITFGVVALLLVSVATVTTIQFRGSAEHLTELEAARIKLGVQQAAVNFADHMAAMRRDVRFIAEVRPLRAIVRSEAGGDTGVVEAASRQQWKERLSEIFQGILHANSTYTGVQLIRLGEAPRILVASGRPAPGGQVPDVEIDRSSLLFDLDTMSHWVPGTIHTSELRLMTAGYAVAPQRMPMIQGGVVIEGANGSRFAVVVLSLNLATDFQLLSDSLPDGQKMVMADRSGSIIIRSVIGRSAVVHEAEAFSLPDRYPELSEFLEDPDRLEFSGMVSGAQGEEIAYLTKTDLDPEMPGNKLVIGSFSPADRVLVATRELRNEAVLTSGVLVLLGGAMAFVVVHMLLGGLRQLTRAARMLAQGGDFGSIELPPAGSDEIGELTRAFDNMIDVISLRESMLRDSEAHFRSIVDAAASAVLSTDESGQIEAANPAAARLFGTDDKALIGRNLTKLLTLPDPATGSTALETFMDRAHQGSEVMALRADGTEFPARLTLGKVPMRDRQIYTAIVADLTEQKKLDRMRSEFVSTVSHELRTPLTSIKGSLGLMKASALGELSDQARSMLTIAHDNCDRLVRLINDILDMEKIEAGKLMFDFAPVDVLALLEGAIRETGTFGEQYGVTIARGDVPENLQVEADRDRLTQVMINLISNAVKFSPRGETVTIGAEAGEESVRITVADRGPGIPEEFQERIFQKFAQADSSTTRQKGGTGLGLSVSKLIIEAHGGMIGFETEQGRGSVFFFELPLLGKDLPHCAEGHGRPRPKVLVCEDDADVGQLLRILIDDMGFDAEVCTTGARAMSRLGEESFAAMTLDLGMPDRDGMSLIRELRASDETRDLPVIVVSAQSPTGDEDLEGAAFGVLDWLEKPIDADRLRSGLARAVSGARSEPIRILHVEDNTDHIAIVSQLVGDAGTVDVAGTCAKARRLLEAKDYDLVILDLMLSDGPGESLLPLINSSGTVPPQILVFSMLEPAEGLRAKVDSALVKSRTSNRKLKERLETLLRANRTSHEIETFA